MERREIRKRDQMKTQRAYPIVWIISGAFVFIVCLSSIVCGGLDDDDPDISSGAEKVYIGPSTTRMVPKGAFIKTKDGVLKTENAGAYAGRKFEEMEKRLKKIEQSQQEIKDKIAELSKIVDGLKNKGNDKSGGK